jgi:hypothetical protein
VKEGRKGIGRNLGKKERTAKEGRGVCRNEGRKDAFQGIKKYQNSKNDFSRKYPKGTNNFSKKYQNSKNDLSRKYANRKNNFSRAYPNSKNNDGRK